MRQRVVWTGASDESRSEDARGWVLGEVLWVEDGEPDWLDQAEHRRLVEICAVHGYDVAEVWG